MRVALGVSGGIAAYKAPRDRARTGPGRLRGAGGPHPERRALRHAAGPADAVPPQGAARRLRPGCRGDRPPHRAVARPGCLRGGSGHRQRAGEVRARDRGRPPVHVLPGGHGTRRGGAGHEHPHVGAPGGARVRGPAPGPRGARRRSRERAGWPRTRWGSGAWPIPRPSWPRPWGRRAGDGSFRASGSWSPPARRASRWTPSATCPTAPRGRWAMPWRRPRPGGERRCCWSADR